MVKPFPRRLPILGLALLSGCSWFRGDDRPARVTASDFYTPTTVPTAALVPQLPKRPAVTPDPDSIDLRPAASTRTSPVVSVGSYLTIGGVLAEVNGVPIFASRIMHRLEPILQKEAKRYTAAEFAFQAKRHLDDAMSEAIRDEIFYAAAQHNLEQDDKKLADALTTDFRQKLILDAGGSVQNARRIAASQGESFEDVVGRQNREYLITLFYQKKIYPRIQVTTADMRRYYRDNVEREFTERASISARIIRIDPARSGGKTAAIEKIRALRERVTAGKEDFATVAGATNDDGLLLRSAGAKTFVPGTLTDEKLDAALVKTPVGGVTDVVDDVNGLYIAKVESKVNGKIAPFEDPDVQARIREAIIKVQRSTILEQYEAEQRGNRVVRQDDQMRNTALELIEQSYPIWHAQ